jgi:hypothetical protein
MNIQDVLEICLGRAITLPPNYYPQHMEMLEREWSRFDKFGSRPEFAGWFRDHPQAAEPYREWGEAGKPSRVLTLREHLDAIGDHQRAARGLV